MAFTISTSGTKAEVTAKLNELESPPTDHADYAGHCHAKQHAIDFVSRAQDGASLTISISGNTEGGKRYVSASMSEG